MITIISPAKTMDPEVEVPALDYSIPDFLEDSEAIIAKLRGLSKKRLSALMSINKELTEVNAMRYASWSPQMDLEVARPAVLTFSGEVYRGLKAGEMSLDDLGFAQDHLRILSGLHGLLRPLDLIRPYRLEMGTSIAVKRKQNLYAFWSARVTETLNALMASSGSNVLINLASTEYSKVIDQKKLKGRVISPVFKDAKNGEYKVVMTWAKHARGAMARYIIRNRINEPQEIKSFDGYLYNERLSTGDEWVFTRG